MLGQSHKGLGTLELIYEFVLGLLLGYSQDVSQLVYICVYLSFFKLPSEIEKINGYTFCYCTSLKKIEIPDSVTEIGVGAFDYCATLEEVKLPSKIEKINVITFSDCTSTSSPSKVIRLGFTPKAQAWSRRPQREVVRNSPT